MLDGAPVVLFGRGVMRSRAEVEQKLGNGCGCELRLDLEDEMRRGHLKSAHAGKTDRNATEITDRNNVIMGAAQIRDRNMAGREC